MTLSLILIGLWFLSVVIAVLSAPVIVPNGALIAVYQLGKFLKLYPPGFYIVMPFITKKVLLKPGIIGIATSESTLEVDNHQIEVQYSQPPRIGSAARIEKFEGVKIFATQANVPNERIVKCEKCGHNNKLRV